MESDYQFTNHKAIDLSFEKYLLSLDYNLDYKYTQNPLNFQDNHNENENMNEIDKIQRSIFNYCSNNMADLNDDSFTSRMSTTQSNITPLINLDEEMNSPVISNETNTTRNIAFDQQNHTINKSSSSHRMNHNIISPSKTTELNIKLRNDDAISKNHKKNNNNNNMIDYLSYFDNNNEIQGGGDNINKIFDMISNMMDDNQMNKEQRIAFLFQQLYSLQNLLINTKNELSYLENSIKI